MPAHGLPSRMGGAPWLPWTPRRAARMALECPWRLAFVYWLGAFVAAAPLCRLADAGWFAAIDQAVAQLPEHAGLDQGRLDWPESRRRVLGQNLFLSLAVAPSAGRPGPASGDVHLEWTLDALWVQGPLGSLRIPYPREWRLELSRDAIAPAWQAWRPHLLLACWMAGGLVLGWLGSLVALAASPGIRLAARGLGRPVRGLVAWRLVRAACLQAAPVTAVLLGLYALRRLTLAMTLLGLGAQSVWVLVWLLLAPFGLPRPENPFRPSGEPAGDEESGAVLSPAASRTETPQE